MHGFFAQITLINILSVLLFIASIWILVIIIGKKSGYMFRAMVFFLFVLLALIYLQQSEAKKYTLNDLKLAVFPTSTPNYHYDFVRDDGDVVARYTFHDPKPRISLSMDPSGKYFHINNTASVNSILDYLKLPRVKSGVKELAFVTGSSYDINLYRWEDYSRGILILERTLCRSKRNLETFICVDRITIKKRYRK
ncbi:MAG: hypothetical protein JXB23_14425 [Candidatus Aminicenantes bacterium]|nr:hypothetical protein [Candidatus Aminicenantes bacterium]